MGRMGGRILQKGKSPSSTKNRTYERPRMAKDDIRVQGSLETVRKQAGLAEITEEEHDAGTWLNLEYADRDIDIKLRNLKNRKARGNDGIPRGSIQSNRKLGIRSNYGNREPDKKCARNTWKLD